ncbi:MAG: TlpA family protein disulfide reductase [bacterium]|nr:TlpA family protein disulfide reductase [bacterium]
MRKTLSIAAGLALSFLMLPSCGGNGGASPSAADVPIEVVDFDGLVAAVSTHTGEGLLLNFWATWCAPCVVELPELLEVGEAYEAQGGRVLGVSYDLMVPVQGTEAIEDELRAFLTKKGFALPTLIYDELDYDSINAHYELPGEVPVTLAIDKDGNVVDRQEGSAGKARFEEMMRKALGL